jgi:hypothetical protein
MLQEYVLNVLVFCCSKCFHIVSCKCLSGSCICCTAYIRIFEVYVSNILAVFRSMLQVFYLDFAYVVVAIHICCKRMFSDISSVSDVCYSKCFMLHAFSFADTESRDGPCLHAPQHGMCRRVAAGAYGRVQQVGTGSMCRGAVAATACERVQQQYAHWAGRCGRQDGG